MRSRGGGRIYVPVFDPLGRGIALASPPIRVGTTVSRTSPHPLPPLHDVVLTPCPPLHDVVLTPCPPLHDLERGAEGRATLRSTLRGVDARKGSSGAHCRYHGHPQARHNRTRSHHRAQAATHGDSRGAPRLDTTPQPRCARPEVSPPTHRAGVHRGLRVRY